MIYFALGFLVGVGVCALAIKLICNAMLGDIWGKHLNL